LTSKTGPTGTHALFSCYEELEIIPDSLRRSIGILGGPLLESRMEQVLFHSKDIKEVFPLKEEVVFSSFRRISYFSDPDGKTRVVALGDYWSQTALKPVHDRVFKILKTIYQDQTFDQAKGLQNLAHMTGTEFYCYDLSAFTDRFPLSMIIEFLTLLWGEDIANAINDIFIGYPFDVESQRVSYNVGNPMGFYGSWGLTTLLHHFVIYWACQNIKINWLTSKYKVLGDDIMLWDGDLALEYKRLIKYIGVEISEQKTIIGKPLFEFAKKIYFNGNHISPISFLSWKESTVSISGLVDTYHELIERGVNITDSSETFVLQNFIYLSNIFSKKRKAYLSKKLSRLIKFIVNFSQFRKEKISGVRLLGELLAPIPSKLHWSLERACKQAIMLYFAGKLQEALESFQGDMSDQITDLFLSLGNWTPSDLSSNSQFPVESVDKSEVVFAVPHAYIIGQFIEQPYMDMQRQIQSIDSDPQPSFIRDTELKLIALDWSLNPKIKSFGREQTRRRISLRSSAKSLHTFLTDDEKVYYQNIVNKLPLSTVVNSYEES
jgi:hypothetical protein